MNAVQHLVRGFRYGYPPCCVLRFCFDRSLGRRDSYAKRGKVDGRYVPCGVFHK